MWIRLLKSHTLFNGKKLPMGRVIQVTTEYAEPLIESKEAEQYTGPLPPIEKMKTELFNPKK
jgi:hypothetical protein